MNPLYSIPHTPLNEQRVQNLKSMLDSQREGLLQHFNNLIVNLLKNKKYKIHEQLIKAKLDRSARFVRNITYMFFEMISDRQYLLETPQIDINQKILKFKKNMLSAWHRLIAGFDLQIQHFGKGKQIQTKQNISTPFQELREQDEEDGLEGENQQDLQSKQSKTSSLKSKNYKISTEASFSMMKWLLQNFENPYPTTEQKQQMARQGGISLAKVNNWFINARQRTVKSYFSKGKN